MTKKIRTILLTASLFLIGLVLSPFTTFYLLDIKVLKIISRNVCISLLDNSICITSVLSIFLILILTPIIFFFIKKKRKVLIYSVVAVIVAQTIGCYLFLVASTGI